MESVASGTFFWEIPDFALRRPLALDEI